METPLTLGHETYKSALGLLLAQIYEAARAHSYVILIDHMFISLAEADERQHYLWNQWLQWQPHWFGKDQHVAHIYGLMTVYYWLFGYTLAHRGEISLMLEPDWARPLSQRPTSKAFFESSTYNADLLQIHAAMQAWVAEREAIDLENRTQA